MSALYERLLLEAELERDWGWAPAAPNAAPSYEKGRFAMAECHLMWAASW